MKKAALILVPAMLAVLAPLRALAADYTVQTDLFNSVVLNLVSAAFLQGFVFLPDLSVEKAASDNVGLKADLLLSTDLKAQWLDAETMWYPLSDDISGLYLGGGLFGIRSRIGTFTAGLKAEAGYKLVTGIGLTFGVTCAEYVALAGGAFTAGNMLGKPGLTVGYSW